jgi:hypothetical protein
MTSASATHRHVDGPRTGPCTSRNPTATSMPPAHRLWRWAAIQISDTERPLHRRRFGCITSMLLTHDACQSRKGVGPWVDSRGGATSDPDEGSGIGNCRGGTGTAARSFVRDG